MMKLTHISNEWYYITGLKMGFTVKEIGRMTLRKFRRYYKAYKQNFDLELLLLLSRKTYSSLEEAAADDEDWLK